MKKSNKEKDLQFELDICKQFIKLTLGEDALNRINRQIDIERTNKLLSIETPEKFNEALLEKAILDNV